MLPILDVNPSERYPIVNNVLIGICIFYVSCGLISARAHFFLTAHPELPMVGASGAIAGVMGACFIRFPTARVLTMVPLFLCRCFLRFRPLFFWGSDK